ncbi:MAG TPA: T9SS type A sorting domain-containing protein [Candidatus Paceibacterota bacterium]
MSKLNFLPGLPVTLFSPESLSSKLVTGNTLSSSSATLDTAMTANLARFFPFYKVAPATFARAFVFNGATVSGNIEIGIYDAKGRKVTSVSAAQAGASVMQLIDITDFTLYPGMYYLAMAMDNGTGTVKSSNAPSAAHLGFAGAFEMAAAYPLPATATFALPTTSVLPYFGFTQRSNP